MYKERVIYVQKAHQTQDNETMVDKPNAHHAWFPDQKETSFLEERESLFPGPANDEKPNSICVLAMPTQLQVPPPFKYCEKLTLI